MKKKNGLVLQGGGVKGSYQIGAFCAFRDCHINFDGYVGTSIGAFNAAMLASGKEDELLKFWVKLDPGKVLGFNKDLVSSFNGEEVTSKEKIVGLVKTTAEIIKNMGIHNEGLLYYMDKLLDEDKLLNSDKDFGLVTVRLPKVEPMYIYKNMMEKGKLKEYILASAYLPVFREKRIIDGHYYIDGGFHDNSPSNMLADLGYDNLYVSNVKGIGINRHHTHDGVNITEIVPSRPNGSILELNRAVIKDNIMMGYYDTLRVLKKYDGYKYCFKRYSDKFYDFILRKIDKRELRRVMNFFNAKSKREAVIKSLEYVLEKDKVDYYDVYKPYKMIRKYKDNTNKHFIYKFISKIKFLWIY